MTTILKELDTESRETLHDIYKGIFLHGECYAFAIALSRGTGWPMVGLLHGDALCHVGVRQPDGMLHDIRGAVSEEEFGEPFDTSSSVLVPVTEDMLHAITPVGEMIIMTASRTAQALWPDLPWKENTLVVRVQTFAAALEKLCREHGFWIRGATPGNSPMIAVSGDDEGGYVLEPTGFTYTINRYLV